MFKEFETVIDNNYRPLRDLVQNTAPPCLPYIGVYLTDLTFVQEGNPVRCNRLFLLTFQDYIAGTEDTPVPCMYFIVLILTY